LIYADNAATTKLDPDAFASMKPFLLEEYGNASQPYSFSRSARKALLDARERIAKCIGALPEEIFFTSCGTESDNWAIKGILLQDSSYGAITTSFEHHAVLRPFSAMERLGHKVSYLHPRKAGIVSCSCLSDALKSSNPKLVSVMAANNEIGTIQPIRELCEIAHLHGSLFHTDAVQAVGHIPIDVKDLGVDMLSSSAHKFNGPKGIGFLYVRKGTNLIQYMDGGAQENGMRAGTENIASIIGMATALEKNVANMDANRKHLLNLESIILDTLSSSPVDYLRNGSDPHIPGNLSLSFKGCEGEMLMHRLDLMGIMVSTGSACDSKNTQISHVLKAIDLDEEYALGTIRISLGKDNTEDEAKAIASAILRILDKKVR